MVIKNKTLALKQTRVLEAEHSLAFFQFNSNFLAW